MSISALRDTLKTGLETISGLKVYDTVPDAIGQLPAFFMLPKSGDYDQAASGQFYRLMLEGTLLIRRVSEVQQAQDSLDSYLQPTGSSSVKAAIEAVDYSTDADVVRVSGFRDYGGLEFAGQQFIGCKFDIECYLWPT
ncbi:MAG: hypothetical protein Q8O55_11425 [Dehalococcoidales bacterium]|nr:hypothetical protein [Dehalococcoidales bacterium]